MAPQHQAPSGANRKSHNNSTVGSIQKIKSYPALDWSDVENEVVHLADFAAKFTQSQVGHLGVVTQTMAVPVEYLIPAMLAHTTSTNGMVYIRVYHVPEELFEDEQERRKKVELEKIYSGFPDDDDDDGDDSNLGVDIEEL